jgi:hypothetical protein
MKTELNKALELIDKGLSAKTLSKLTESQINILHKKLLSEVTMVSKDDSATVQKLKSEKKPFEVYEDETDDVGDDNALGKDALQSYTGQDAPHDANDMAPDGMDDDSDDKRSMMGVSEEKKKGKNREQNPWAICTAQLGKEFGTRERHMWSAKEKNKYERCVRDVKQSLKEGKNPVSLFLENEIMRIVEKNLPPRITKGDLVKYISEQGPSTAPSKPATKPTVKPGKPDVRPRPQHPGKNPNPGVNPAPKAVSPDKAKDKVIDLIINLLEK